MAFASRPQIKAQRVTGLFHSNINGKHALGVTMTKEGTEQFINAMADILDQGAVPRFTLWDNGPAQNWALTMLPEDPANATGAKKRAAGGQPQRGSGFPKNRQGGGSQQQERPQTAYKRYAPKAQEIPMSEPLDEDDGFIVEDDV